jgi:hypothetical protein
MQAMAGDPVPEHIGHIDGDVVLCTHARGYSGLPEEGHEGVGETTLLFRAAQRSRRIPTAGRAVAAPRLLLMFRALEAGAATLDRQGAVGTL